MRLDSSFVIRADELHVFYEHLTKRWSRPRAVVLSNFLSLQTRQSVRHARPRSRQLILFSLGQNRMTVALREVTKEDLPIFFEHQLDAEATRMAAFPSRDRDAFMAHWARIMSKETNETGILKHHPRGRHRGW